MFMDDDDVVDKILQIDIELTKEVIQIYYN